MKSISFAAGAALAAAIALPASAATVLGFETGDTSGWSTANGLVEVVTGADDAIVTPPYGEHYDPTEGTYFARLTASSDVGTYTTLSHAIHLDVLSHVSFDTAFLAFDYLPDYDDDAYVRIYDVSASEMVFQSNVSAVGDYGHTDWLSFSRTLGPGDYTIEAGVRNAFDTGGDSQLLVDNVAVTVPEPQSWALMILGFVGLGALLRARRSTVAQKA